MIPQEYQYQYRRSKRAREGKYNAHKVTTAFGKFDSSHEYNVFLNLLDKQERGLISDLHRQVEYELIPAQYEKVIKHLKKRDKEVEVCVEKKCSYYADFTFTDCDGKFHVLDAKGMKTDVYKLKKKLMLWRHGIKIEEV